MERLNKQGFLRMPLDFNAENKNYTNKMCCCRSHVPHDESQKFILHGDEAANNQIIFDDSKQIKRGNPVGYTAYSYAQGQDFNKSLFAED